jgi:hypothetical protein
MYVERHGEAHSRNHFLQLTSMSITQTVCVFLAFGTSTQCACAILSSMVSSALQNVFTLSHKGHDLKKCH